MLRSASNRVGESISRPYSEDKGQRIAILIIFQETRELFGCESLSTGIHERQRRFSAARRLTGCCPPAQLQKRSFITQSDPIDLDIARNPFQVFIGERLNRRLFRLPNPCNLDLHGGQSSLASRCQYHRSSELDVLSPNVSPNRA